MTMYTRRAVLLCLTMFLAACQDATHPPTAAIGDDPGSTLSLRGSLIVVGSTLTCDFRAAQAYARDYFDQPEKLDVAALLRAMEDARGAGDEKLARELGFDVLAVVARVADAGTAAGGAADGSNLVNAVLTCMDVGHATAVDFSGPVAFLGAFGVRGGDDDPTTAPVLARGSSPVWGAEPSGGATWAAALGQPDALGERRVLYATPLAATSFTSEVPVSSAYEWNAVPTPATVPFAGELAVGACLSDPEPKLRVQRSSSILPFEALSFCADAGSSLVRRAGDAGLIDRFAGVLATVLAPAPLHASAALLGGVGGRLRNFSPIVVVDAGAVNLTFTVQPTDALVGQPFPVQVTARGDGGTPLPEVTIVLAIAENNASFGELSGTTSVTTGSDGVAAFEVSLNKPGGFRLKATGDLAGFATSSVSSDLFHIRQ